MKEDSKIILTEDDKKAIEAAISKQREAVKLEMIENEARSKWMAELSKQPGYRYV